MIRLVLALLVNQFVIALRKRSKHEQLRGKGASGAAGAVAESLVLSRPVDHGCCKSNLASCRFFTPTSHPRRIPANTKLERFLAVRGIGPTHLCHRVTHFEGRFPATSSIHNERLLAIRKGAPATPDEKSLLSAAITSLLGEPVTVEMLFDEEHANQNHNEKPRGAQPSREDGARPADTSKALPRNGQPRSQRAEAASAVSHELASIATQSTKDGATTRATSRDFSEAAR